MKDFLGNEVEPGDFFAYPLTIGHSVEMAVYKFVAVNDSGNVRANKIEATYSTGQSWRYKIWERPSDLNASGWRDMTEAERAKVDSKISTLQFFGKKAIKLPNYEPKILHSESTV